MAKTAEELKQLKQEYECLTKKLNELSEEELMCVIGGIGERLKTIVVRMELPEAYPESSILDVYVDGLIERSQSRTLGPGISTINLEICGLRGISRVQANINEMRYKEYAVDFDRRTYTEL